MIPPPVTLASCLRPSDDALSRELDGQLVFLQLETEAYFGLDAIGTRMWECLTSAESVAAAVGVLEQEFEVGRAELERDVIELATDLVERRLLVVE